MKTKVISLYEETLKELLYPTLTLQICTLGTQKVKHDPKIKSKSKVRIEENIENKSYSTTSVEHKIGFESYPDPKNSPLGP